MGGSISGVLDEDELGQLSQRLNATSENPAPSLRMAAKFLDRLSRESGHRKITGSWKDNGEHDMQQRLSHYRRAGGVDHPAAPGAGIRSYGSSGAPVSGENQEPSRWFARANARWGDGILMLVHDI